MTIKKKRKKIDPKLCKAAIFANKDKKKNCMTNKTRLKKKYTVR